MMNLFLLLFTGTYILASINVSILLFKILGKNDPRRKFSGNPGAFNVYRILGLRWASVVLLLDICRAMGTTLISIRVLEMDWIPWVGFGLILGNRMPCFHRFRGGKGVAGYLGFSVILVPLFAAVSALAWLISYSFCRIAFIGSLVMVFILGTGTWFSHDFHFPGRAGIIASMALIVYSHNSNMSDLIRKRKGGLS